MRNRNRRWIFFWFLISILQLVFSDESNHPNGSSESSSNGEKNLKNIYSPRMDYDQWKPLGRGDPLKNDPTYDYVPPVLDRVQYWVDPAMRKPDPPIPGETQKTEILLLGVTSRKPASGPPQADSRRDMYDPYVKYVEGTKFSQNPNQRISRPSFIPPLSTSFLPSFFPLNKNKYMDRTPFSKGTEQRVPYTMLMPPPLDIRAPINALPNSPGPLVTQSPIINFPTSETTTTKIVFTDSTSSSVTVQAADLVYHSSSLSNRSEWENKDSTIASDIIWEQPSSTKKATPDFRDEVVYSTHLTPPESYIRIEFLPHNFTNSPLVGADSNHNINYVTPPPLVKSIEKEVMFKGQVTDDNVDISNTYVNIGKPEAEVHSTGIGMSSIPLDRVVQHPVPSNMIMFPHSIKPSVTPIDSGMSKLPPLTVQKLQEMQTMHPPPVTQSPVFTKPTNTLFKLLDKEKRVPMIVKETPVIHLEHSTSSSNIFVTSTTSTSTTPTITTPVTTTTAVSTTRTSTTTTAVPASTTPVVDIPTTTTSALTTDPLFKHYKQPVEPLKGPLYLIIQGHSKVKTYGPSKQMHGISIQDTNEISDSDDKYEVKHLHSFNKESEMDDNTRKARSGDIQTLKHVVQTGLGAIDLTDIDEAAHGNNEDVQEAELQVGYEVGEDKDATEKYHKGIVEEARKLKL